MAPSRKLTKTIHALTLILLSAFFVGNAPATSLNSRSFLSLLRSSALSSRWKFAVRASSERLKEGFPLTDLERYSLARTILYTGNLKGAGKIADSIKNPALKAFFRGESHLAENRLENSIKEFARAGEKGMEEGYYAAALVSLKMGDPASAERFLSRIQDDDPILSTRRDLKAAVCDLFLGKSSEARNTLTRLLSRKSESLTPADRAEALYLLSAIATDGNEADELLKLTGELASLSPSLEAAISEMRELGRFPEEFFRLEEKAYPLTLVRWFDSASEPLGNLGVVAAEYFYASRLLRTASSTIHRIELLESSLEREKDAKERILADVDEKIGLVELSLEESKSLRERITSFVDGADVFSLVGGTRWKEILEKVRRLSEKTTDLEVKLGEVSEKVKIAGEKNFEMKLSDREKTILKKAIKRYYELSKEVDLIKARAGMLRARATNLAKGPLIRKALQSLKRVKEAEERASKARFRLKKLKSELSAQVDYARRRIARAKKLAARLNNLRKRTRELLSTLEKEYASYASLLAADLESGLQILQSEIHHLRGRAYLHLALEGKEGPGGENPYVLASREFRAALEGALPKLLVPEALYFLGETAMTIEEEAFAEKMEGAEKLEREGKDFEEPRLDYTRAFGYFQRLVKEHPSSPYVESALYNLAYGKNEMGLLDESVELYEKLIRAFPRTRYADEINLRIAEYYFNSDEFPTAEHYYRKVSRNGNPELYLTARFKLGWSLYNQDRFEEAVEAFLVPLKFSDSTGKLRFARLADESLRMAARCFVEMNDLTGLAEKLKIEGLTALIPRGILEEERILFDASRFDELLSLASDLRKNHPLAPELLESELLASESLIKSLREELGYKRMVEAGAILAPGTKWFEWNGKNSGFADEAKKKIERMMREGAYYFYKKGKEKKRTWLLKEAIRSFREYLKAFPHSAFSDDVRFDLAMALFSTGSYRSAARIFTSVFERTEKEKLKEPSLYMSIQSLKAAYRPGKVELAEGIISAGKTYAAAFPHSERTVEVLLDVAKTLFNEKMYERAVEITTSILSMRSSIEQKMEALRIRGDSLFNRGKYTDAETTYRELLSLTKGRPSETKRVSHLVALCILKDAQVLENRGKLQEAAARYERVFEEFPSVEFSPLSALSGAKAYIRAKSLKRAERLLASIIDRFPGSPFEQEGRRLLAKIYEARGELEKAAENYRLIGEALSKKAEGVAFLRKAGKMYYEMGVYDRALRSFEKILESGNISREIVAEALYYAGKSMLSLGEGKRGRRLLERAVKMGKDNNVRVKHFAALSLLEIAALTFDEYRKVKIEEPFAVTFRKKEKLLKKLIETYLKVARYGIPETLSQALYMIAESYEEFKNAILDAPMPKGLTQTEQEEYIFLLEEKAAPFEEKAAETHVSNVKKAAANGYVNEWVKMSLDKLKELRPAIFGRKPSAPPLLIPVITEPKFEPTGSGVLG